MGESRISFVAGRMLCGEIRDYLKRIEFHGVPIRWYEGKGWFERTFEIVGPASDITNINNDLRRFIQENNLDE